MKHSMQHTIHLAESAVDSVNKFISSIDHEETASAIKTIQDSFSAELLAMLPILVVLQALVQEEIITKEQYARLATEMCNGEPGAMDACKVLMVVNIKRLQGEDFFNGKEI